MFSYVFGMSRKDSGIALASTEQAKCSEYFHQATPYPSETKPCAGKHHATPFHVCKDCITTAASCQRKRGKLEGGGYGENVLQKDLCKELCLKCTAHARSQPDINGKGCCCTSNWYCFECRDVISFRGQVVGEDTVDRETKQPHRRAGKEHHFCPGCEGFFQIVNEKNHAQMCMGCREILREAVITSRDEDERDAMCPKDIPYAPLQSPNYCGCPPGLKTRQLADEEVAPDEMPAAQLVAVEEATNEITAAPTSPGASKLIEWNFPRSSGVKIGPPKPGANGASDLQTRHMLRCFAYSAQFCCWICGDKGHATESCQPKLLLPEEREGEALLGQLMSTQVEDNEEMGLGDLSGWQ